ncbi:MAG: hypothetical protein HGA45_21300, partial [Chloroflexales bacterium]|nr:hypothetical protein [Chloroflexales bacterium]
NLTSAEFFFQQALSLGIDDAQASGGLAQTANAQASGGLGQIATTQSITQEALRATAAAQTRAAELLRRWQAVEDAGSAPERQVALLVALESEGVAADPKGVQITKRLFDARMGYGDDLLKQQRFIEALAIYDLAGLNASDADAATRQRVADSKANTFLQQAQSALDAQSFVLAGEYVNRVFTLTPPPSTALRQQAELRLTAIAEAKQTLDNRVRLQQAWRAYDDARNNGQWSIALGVLADIVSVAGEQPDQSAFPPDENDLRLYDIPQLRADTRLRLAADLLVGGQIDGARAQYDAILADSNVDTKIRSQSASEEAKLQTVSDLWSTVNRARRDGRWKDVETTLQKLATMVGEGGRNPVQGRTVAALRREAQLQTEAARQSLITPSAPVVAPSATEAAPSATVDAGLPTVMPTADPNVLPTADPGAPPAGSATPAEPETPSPSDGQAPGGGSTQP